MPGLRLLEWWQAPPVAHVDPKIPAAKAKRWKRYKVERDSERLRFETQQRVAR